ncbi:MAG TPA: 50S ribosomal protein L9 [Bacteroidetes bacterium]|nr:MAG: 50S ribosomal protein L9 [Ignavibacteria bacterium GWA2_54_16]HCA81206.1 50S ribosomal protein L9 [Bacteroidota bacterium]
MKVILRQDYEKLGSVGDVVDVKDGYARNYLIPRNIAYQASPNSLLQLEEEKKQHVRRQEKEKRSSEKLAAELEKVSITIQMNVGEDDKLFGSVTSQMIADSLKEKGFTIDKRHIELEDTIKALGIYTVDVRLPGSVIGKVKVWVVRE